MRYIWMMLFIMATATACANSDSGATAPPSDASGQTSGETAIPTDPAFVVVTRQPTREVFELEVPLPGTLVASSTEDPEAALIFDMIQVVQFGGPEGAERREVTLLQDGSYTVNGVNGVTTPQVVADIDAILDELSFFGLQGAMLGPIPDTDDYRYSITVKRGDLERTITMQEGFYPQELDRLLLAVFALGEGQ